MSAEPHSSSSSRQRREQRREALSAKPPSETVGGHSVQSDAPDHDLTSRDVTSRLEDDDRRPDSSELTQRPHSGHRTGADSEPTSELRSSVNCIARYIIRSELGSGGFGRVYRAWDPDLKCEVAIKVPRPDRHPGPEALERFRNEARTLARLRNHPAIVTVYDVGETPEGLAYAVMEFVEGQTLSDCIERQELSLNESLQILMKVAEALKAAHREGVIHRDLKPSNVIRDLEGNVKLVDFGLALHDDLTWSELGDEIEGTPKYMAPEQIRGENHRIDGQTDIWAFGVIMYRMLTGKHPFRAADSRELARVIRYKDPAPPRQLNPKVPREIERICLKCLSKMMKDRYLSVPDVIDELSNAIAEMRAPVPQPRRQARLPQVPREMAASGEGESHRSGLTGPSAGSRTGTTGESRPLRITFKGLRPFDSSDDDFFLHLLPGPRTRDNRPESVQFWLNRIEGDELEPLNVGLIYGPSGCGKSSFVRAGLLPLLPAQVNPVYLECTPEETERRLVRQIAHRIHTVDAGASLADVLRQFRRGEHLAEGDRLLLVLDQFEQWLHDNRDFATAELTEALRQCDGQRVTCLLLVRDDFWMSISEFLKALEIPIREGHNALALPLLDERHARRVLIAYGRAFERLPGTELGDGADLNSQQRRFVRDAVTALSDNGRVICVHLSVFAQIVQDREWTASELHRLGGLQGVGVRFLDGLFGSGGRKRPDSPDDDVVKSVLGQLLPTTLTGIKGTSRTRDQLFAALDVNCSRPAFDRAIDWLEQDLRLISPTDETEWGTEEPAAGGRTRPLRLTHDFLVGPIRDWLERRMQETRRGRAQQRLTNLGEAWNSTGDACYLPGMIEFMSFAWFASRAAKQKYRRFLMRSARKQLGQAGLAGAVLMLFAAVTFFLIDRRSNETAWRFAENYLVTAPESAADHAERLVPWKERARSGLEGELQSESPVRRLRAASFLLQHLEPRDEYSSGFIDAIKHVPDAEARYMTASIALLSSEEQRALVEWAMQLTDQRQRVRWAMLLLNAGHPAAAESVLHRQNAWCRSYFIQQFPDFPWHTDRVLGLLVSSGNGDFQSGVCLGLARWWQQMTEVQHRNNGEILEVMRQLHDSPDSIHGVRSAAEYGLRTAGVVPEFRVAESPLEEGWKSLELIDGFPVTFARIAGGTFDPTDGLTPEIIAQQQIQPTFLMESGPVQVDSFYLCTVPVSEQLFDQWIQQLPADHELFGRSREEGKPASRLVPAMGIRWDHAIEFCNWLSDRHNLPRYYRPAEPGELELDKNAPAVSRDREARPIDRWVVIDRRGPGFRLPWQDECVYAYRAGTRTATPFSDSLADPFWDMYTWFNQDTPDNRIAGPMQARMPNQFGLFDMAGNSSHWCNDLFGDRCYRRVGGFCRSDVPDMLPGVFSYTLFDDVLGKESIRLAINASSGDFLREAVNR